MNIGQEMRAIINQIAHERGHSAGQSKVDMIENDLLYGFRGCSSTLRLLRHP